jgi:preprotein translocase subunit SecG
MSNLLLVLFIASALLLVILVLIQDDQGEGAGGLFSGSAAPFRSRSGNLLQHITTGVAIFFFVSAFGYALVVKPQDPLGNLGLGSEDGVFLDNILNADESGEGASNSGTGTVFEFPQDASSGLGVTTPAP